MERTVDTRRDVPANERGWYMGGMMRCCIESLLTNDAPSNVGDKLPCNYGKPMPGHEGWIVEEDGCWHWNHVMDWPGEVKMPSGTSA